MATMIAPSPFQVIQAITATYTADAAGVITAVAQNDVNALRLAGCEQVGLASGTAMIGRLLGVNMNVTTDQQIPMFNGSQVFRITKISVKNASISLTTAAGGVYPAASKGGTAIVAAAQVYSALTASNLALDLTIVAGPGTTEYASTQSVFFSLTTAQGAAATADLFIYGDLAQ